MSTEGMNESASVFDSDICQQQQRRPRRFISPSQLLLLCEIIILVSNTRWRGAVSLSRARRPAGNAIAPHFLFLSFSLLLLFLVGWPKRVLKESNFCSHHKFVMGSEMALGRWMYKSNQRSSISSGGSGVHFQFELLREISNYPAPTPTSCCWIDGWTGRYILSLSLVWPVATTRSMTTQVGTTCLGVLCKKKKTTSISRMSLLFREGKRTWELKCLGPKHLVDKWLGHDIECAPQSNAPLPPYSSSYTSHTKYYYYYYYYTISYSEERRGSYFIASIRRCDKQRAYSPRFVPVERWGGWARSFRLPSSSFSFRSNPRWRISSPYSFLHLQVVESHDH